MAAEYDELHEHSYNNLEEYSSDADIKLGNSIVQVGDFLDSKTGISLISDANVAQCVLLENVKVENADEQLSKDIVSTEDCEKYNSDADIKLEDFIVQTEDSLDSKAGISLISDHNLAQGVLLENVKVENLDDQSDKNFKYKYELRTPKVSLKLDKITACAQCGKWFEGKSKLDQHIRRVHFTRKDHSCSYCKQTFRFKIDLTSHTRVHTGEKPFTCEVCKKSFSQKSGLTCHMKTHTGEKPYTCVVCKKSFYARHKMNRHMKTHTGEKPFSCEFCERSFGWKESLILHIKTHTGEKPFTCEICNKKFFRKNELASHTKNHTGEKPFTCELCNRSFRWRNGLISHIKTHTGEKPFTCEICEKSFYERGRLNRHIKAHTGEKRLTANFVENHLAALQD